MKTSSYKLLIITCFLIFFIAGNSYSQTPITWDLDDSVSQQEISLNKGVYTLTIKGTYDPTKIDFQTLLIQSTTKVEPIETDKLNEVKTSEQASVYKTIQVYTFTLGERSKIELKVKKIDLANSKVIKTYDYTINGIITHKWHTTFGVAGIALRKSDTYKTIQEGSTFKVVEDGSQEIIDPVVVMQFSYINLEKDTWHGPTGGIGFDLENISVFAGWSVYFGHNIVLTGGAALHKQLRLNNKYDVNQIVPNALSSDDLNSDYYRINPFISLTFALDKNIFKK